MAIANATPSDDDEVEEIHDINVTPFIDVTLVLLIIFMVAAPLSTVDVPVDLPSSSAAPPKRPDKPIYVTIKPDLALAIGEDPVQRGELLSALDARSASAAAKESRIFLRADRAVAYGDLMNVLEMLRLGSYHTLALIAPPGVYSYGAKTNLDLRGRVSEGGVWFDDVSGDMRINLLQTREGPADAIERWLRALHFGDIRDSGVYRIAVCLFGLLTAVLSTTGLYIWQRKRRAALRRGHFAGTV